MNTINKLIKDSNELFSYSSDLQKYFYFLNILFLFEIITMLSIPVISLIDPNALIWLIYPFLGYIFGFIPLLIFQIISLNKINTLKNNISDNLKYVLNLQIKIMKINFIIIYIILPFISSLLFIYFMIIAISGF